MQALVKRKSIAQIKEYMDIFPAVAILGPRQSGKSTLANMIGKSISGFIYLDLENPADFRRIDDIQLFFDLNPDSVVCLDEVQLRPDLYPELRSIIDRNRKKGKLILLGSASRELVNKSSESLAGRIGYIELTPFTLSEIDSRKTHKQPVHWIRGGFPLSYLARTDKQSFIWRKAYLRSYLERDIIQGSNSIPLMTVSRMLQMLAHNHGQIFNSSRMGESLNVSHNTIRSYLDFFTKSFLVRTLQPYLVNPKKRLTKSPRIFIRDSGLLHCLLEIENMNQLLGHPVYGSSWEGYVIENIITALYEWEPWFYRTATGCEIDLLLTKGSKKIAFECKATKSPSVAKGTYIALQDTGIKELFIVSPVSELFYLSKNVIVGNITHAIAYVKGKEELKK
jgi:predicted AAA+ superfamily ATPase